MSSLGILCAWYSKSSESNVLTFSPRSTQKERIEELGMDDTGEEIVVVEEVKEKNKEDEKNVEEIIHFYVPISSYVCTLPHECFEKDFVADMEGVHEHNDEALHLATASKLVLTSEAVANIELLLEKRKTTTKKQPMSNDSECWIQYGGYILNKKHFTTSRPRERTM